MTVAVNPVQKDNTDAQMLLGALKVASDLYGVRMNAKQQEAVKKYEVDKEDKKAEAEAAKLTATQKQEFDQKFIPLPQGQENAQGAQVLTRPGETAPKAYISLDLFKQKMSNDADIEKAKIAASSKAKDEKTDLEVPGLGTALSKDDAKQVKNAVESYKNMTTNLEELISLRNQFGGEVLNRSAVNRAKALATDTRFQIKEMAKLGVMSNQDAIMLSSIIPEDPLQFDWSEATLNGLQKMKEDAGVKLMNNLSTRGFDKGAVSNLIAETQRRPTQPQDQQKLNDLIKTDPELNAALQELQNRGLTGTAQRK